MPGRRSLNGFTVPLLPDSHLRDFEVPHAVKVSAQLFCGTKRNLRKAAITSRVVSGCVGFWDGKHDAYVRVKQTEQCAGNTLHLSITVVEALSLWFAVLHDESRSV